MARMPRGPSELLNSANKLGKPFYPSVPSKMLESIPKSQTASETNSRNLWKRCHRCKSAWNQAQSGNAVVSLVDRHVDGRKTDTRTISCVLARHANPCAGLVPGLVIRDVDLSRLRVRTRQGSRAPCLDCRISGVPTPSKPKGKPRYIETRCNRCCEDKIFLRINDPLCPCDRIPFIETKWSLHDRMNFHRFQPLVCTSAFALREQKIISSGKNCFSSTNCYANSNHSYIQVELELLRSFVKVGNFAFWARKDSHVMIGKVIRLVLRVPVGCRISRSWKLAWNYGNIALASDPSFFCLIYAWLWRRL